MRLLWLTLLCPTLALAAGFTPGQTAGLEYDAALAMSDVVRTSSGYTDGATNALWNRVSSATNDLWNAFTNSLQFQLARTSNDFDGRLVGLSNNIHIRLIGMSDGIDGRLSWVTNDFRIGLTGLSNDFSGRLSWVTNDFRIGLTGLSNDLSGRISEGVTSAFSPYTNYLSQAVAGYWLTTTNPIWDRTTRDITGWITNKTWAQ